jgi:hypothetical protein
MKIKEIDRRLDEADNTQIPKDIRYTMPRTIIFPDMDLYYEYYKFATAMAAHPEEENSHTNDRDLRDVPIAVAYTPQEYDMIMSIAKKMGKKTEEIAFGGSREPPGGNTVSPVMKFNAFDSLAEGMRDIIDCYQSLEEARTVTQLHPSLKSTMNSTTIIPELVSSDAYKQYRYTLALAAAKANQAGDVQFDALSAWNESMTAVAYTPAEEEIIALANQLMDVKGVKLSDGPSREPDDIYTTSPVMRFNAFDSLSESMRAAIDQVALDSEEGT